MKSYLFRALLAAIMASTLWVAWHAPTETLQLEAILGERIAPHSGFHITAIADDPLPGLKIVTPDCAQPYQIILFKAHESHAALALGQGQVIYGDQIFQPDANTSPSILGLWVIAERMRMTIRQRLGRSKDAPSAEALFVMTPPQCGPLDFIDWPTLWQEKPPSATKAD